MVILDILRFDGSECSETDMKGDESDADALFAQRIKEFRSEMQTGGRCGGAAALNAELTLPGVSQSVIITRLEGRTPMPEGEKMPMLASHGATMVIFLSAGIAGQVQKELLEHETLLNSDLAKIRESCT